MTNEPSHINKVWVGLQYYNRTSDRYYRVLSVDRETDPMMAIVLDLLENRMFHQAVTSSLFSDDFYDITGYTSEDIFELKLSGILGIR